MITKSTLTLIFILIAIIILPTISGCSVVDPSWKRAAIADQQLQTQIQQNVILREQVEQLKRIADILEEKKLAR